MKNSFRSRLVSLLLTATLIIGCIPIMPVVAEELESSDEIASSYTSEDNATQCVTIKRFALLGRETGWLEIPLPADDEPQLTLADIAFPTELEGYDTEDESDVTSNTYLIPVLEWVCKAGYDFSETGDNNIFEPVFADDYSIDVNANVPKVRVKIVEAVAAKQVLTSTPDAVVNSLAGLQSAIDTAPTNGDVATIAISANISGDTTLITINGGRKIHITSDSGNVYTINRGAYGNLFTVTDSGSELAFSDIIIDGQGAVGAGGGTFSSPPDDENSLVYVVKSATLNLENGATLRNNLNAGYGGGVHVASGSLTMTGATISGNMAFDNSANPSASGGGIYTRGDFTMNSGEIINNIASAGNSNDHSIGGDAYSGGVYVRGTFTMNGGKINNNTAFAYSGEYSFSSYSYGGGVYADTFIISIDTFFKT